MNNKQKQRIRQYLCRILIVALIITSLPANTVVHAAEASSNSITMTEFYSNESYNSDSLKGKVVTINSLDELKLFRDCCSKDNGSRTKGITFQQTTDIYFSDLKFEFDRSKDRVGIYRGDTIIGAMDRFGAFWKDMESQANLSLDSLNIEDGVLSTDSQGAMNFSGTYDGNKHIIGGFAILSDNQSASFFGDISSDGVVKNISFTNVLWFAFMGACVANDNFGIIANCTLTNSCGIEKASTFEGRIGGIVIENYGTVEYCDLDSCNLILNTENSVIGGITAYNAGFISDCNNFSGLLTGYYFNIDSDIEYAGIVGGIAGLQEKELCSVSFCNVSSELDKGRYQGGIIGKILDSNPLNNGSFSIYDCHSSSPIYYGKLSDNSAPDYAGGIVGYIEETITTDNLVTVEIRNCSNNSYLYLNSSLDMTAYIGGILGGSEAEVTINNCANIRSLGKEDSGVSLGGWGGIAGKMKVGRIVNCINYKKVLNDSYKSDSRYNASGGLLGIAETPYVFIQNCLNVGKTSGYYCGGIVGQYLDDPNLTLQEQQERKSILTMQNCVSLGNVQGSFVGTLTSDAGKTSAAYCYSQKWEDIYMLTNGYTEACEYVNKAHLIGTGTEQTISQSPDSYAYTTSLTTALNKWVSLINDLEGEPYYYTWEDSDSGYPILKDTITNLPTAIKYSDTEIVPGESIVSIPPAQSTSSPATDTPSTSAPVQIQDNSGNQSQDGSKNQSTNIAFLSVKKFTVVWAADSKVKLSWKSNSSAEGYYLFRSTKKKGIYQQITTVKSPSTSYLDKKLKSGKTYYYKIQAYTTKNNTLLTGKTVRKKANVKWYRRPSIKLSLKSDNGRKYMQINWKNPRGTHFEIYLKKNKQKYVKVPLKNNKLSSYSGKVRFTYNWKKTIIYCKIRTYKIVKKKKRYSEYSKEKKIRLI